MAEARQATNSAVSSDRLANKLRGLISEARARDPLGLVTVVTPSYYSSYFLRRACAGEGLFNVEFTRIEDIAEHLAAARITGLPLSRLTASQLVFEALHNSPLQGPINEVRDHPSFHLALHRTLTDLQTLDGAVHSRLEALGGPYGYISRIARAYARLAQDHDYYDRSAVGAKSAEEIATHSYHLPALGQLIVLLVRRSAPQYAGVYEALAAVVGAVTLKTYSDVEIAYQTAADSASEGQVASGAAASHLLLRQHETRLVSAPDRVEEALWAARNVLRLVRDHSLRFNQIAVFYSGDANGQRIEEALRLADIPVSGPARQAPADWPEGRFITGLLDARKEFSREAVTAWLTSSPVCVPGTDDAAPGSRWDAISRSAGVTGGIDDWQSRLTSFIDRRNREAEKAERDPEVGEIKARSFRAEAAAAGSLRTFIGELHSVVTADSGPDWSGCVGWLRGIRDRFALQSQGKDSESRNEKLESILTRIAALDSLKLQPPDFSRFEATLRDELARPAGNVRPLGHGVFVAGIRDAGGTDFDAVHIVGMAEGSFPGVDDPDPLLPDDVRATLDASGEKLLRATGRRAAHRLDFLNALSAGRRVFLSWPRSEQGAARESGPSPWFLEAARAVSGKNDLQAGDLSARHSFEQFEWLNQPGAARLGVPGPANVHEYAINHLDTWLRAGRSATGHPLARNACIRFARALGLESARQSQNWTVWDGNLTPRSPLPEAGIAAPASATRFQDWATCPFRYFAGYVLDLTPSERPEDLLEITPLDRGSLVHSILEGFAAAREKQKPADLAAQRRLLNHVAESKFRDFAAEGVTGPAVIWEIEKSQLKRALREWLTRDILLRARLNIKATNAEVRFGFRGSDIPAVELALPGGRRLAFRGVIDRIDEDAAGNLYVYDYKTGASDSYGVLNKGDPVKKGQLLQLPVYALAARYGRRGEAPGSVRAAYWFVLRPQGTGFIPELDRFDEAAAIEALERSAAVIADGIAGGVFPARPGQSRRGNATPGFENCRYCEFDNICPSVRAWQWEKKQAAPQVAAYRVMAEAAGAEAGEDGEE